MMKAAIYGLGRWGQILVESVQSKSEDIQFTHGISRNPDKLAAFAHRNDLQLTTSYDEVLADPGIDAVVLATPHSQHTEQIIQAAKVGKHVYVEKPMALTKASAQDAVDACRAEGIVLAVGFNRRVAPAFVAMQQAVKEGRIGDILHVEGQHSGPTGFRLIPGNWRATREEAPAGGTTGRGIHTLDGMIALCGPVKSVHAVSERRVIEVEIDDTTAMLLRFENGITGYQGTIFATGDLYRIQAYGTKGWAEMRGPYQLSISDLEGKIEKTNFPSVDLEKGILEAFAKAVASGQDFVVNPDDAVNGIGAMEAIVASAKAGETVVID